MFRLRSSFVRQWIFLFVGAAAPACATSGGQPDQPASIGEAITSNDGTPLEFRFSGEVIARANDTPRKAIASQLQYVQGILTKYEANGQIGMPTLSNIRESGAGATKRITYDIALPVVWPKARSTPSSFDIVLPRDTTRLDAFDAKYDGSCGQNEYGSGTFWHGWNPSASGCRPASADTYKTRATVVPNPLTTEGKYPEYDKVWEDGELDVVAIYGIISSYDPEDEGVRTREKFLRDSMASLKRAERTEAPEREGILQDSTVSGTISIGGQERRVNVTAILVQEVSTASSEYNDRFASVTENADLIVYEGHSGLGANINAFARNVGTKRDKYQLIYLYGCETLAYLEPTMHEKRIALNDANRDPDGTKYLDVITTAMPAGGDDARSALVLYRAMLSPNAPKTFNQLIEGIPTRHLVAVFGEHDNTFKP